MSLISVMSPLVSIDRSSGTFSILAYRAKLLGCACVGTSLGRCDGGGDDEVLVNGVVAGGTYVDILLTLLRGDDAGGGGVAVGGIVGLLGGG